MKTNDRHARLLIIGLDGATFRVLDPMRKAGALPNLGAIIDRGAWGVLRSTIPTNSAAAWSSFMTGKNPGKHGVFEFLVQSSRDGEKVVVSSSSIHGETLWQILSRHGLRVVAVNVPITYPPKPVHGAMVSGFPVPGGSRSWTYPQNLVDVLDREVGGYVIETPWHNFLGRVKHFLDALTIMTSKRALAVTHLIDRYQPDVTAVVFVGPDRLQHPLWHHLDPNHSGYRERQAVEHRAAIENYFFELDRAVGGLVDAVGDDVTVLVLSDHGFRAAERQLSLNEWLASQGWLRFRRAGLWTLLDPLRQMNNPVVWRLRSWWHFRAPPRLRRLTPKMGIDWSRTKAYAPWDFQEGVSVNLAGREQFGIVEPGVEYERVRDELRDQLLALRDPETSSRVLREVLFREDHHHGPFVESSADILLAAEDGFDSSAPQSRNTLFRPTRSMSGCHDRDGILIIGGHGIRPGPFAPGPTIEDVAPTVLHLLGLPIPEDMDGRVLDQIYDREVRSLGSPQYEKTNRDGDLGGRDVFTPEESDDIRDKLRGLGYLG